MACPRMNQSGAVNLHHIDVDCAHHRSMISDPQTQRPTQDLIQGYLSRQADCVQDLLRPFALEVEASYPWGQERAEVAPSSSTSPAGSQPAPAPPSIDACLVRLRKEYHSYSLTAEGLMRGRHSIVVVPTGAGKSLLMLLAPYAVLDRGTHSTRQVND